MVCKITSIDEAFLEDGLKILVHGPAGIGKTVLGATTGCETLIISAESGLLSIKGAPDYIKVTIINTIEDLKAVYQSALDGEFEAFKWLVLDSISEIAEVLLSDEKKSQADPRAAYGNLQDEIAKIIRGFRDIPKFNVMMTCKQQRFTDDHTGITIYIPMLPGKALPQQVPYWFDEVFAMRTVADEEGIEVRMLQTDRDYSYDAKDRSGLLDKFEKPSLKAIYQKIYGEEA